MKPGETGLKRVFDATIYSIQGLKAAWKYEEAFRMEIVLLVLLTTLTFFLPVTKFEQLAMIASLFLVVIVELLNRLLKLLLIALVLTITSCPEEQKILVLLLFLCQ